ncbi:MAG: SusC/RagA family TonB-linked outer membrane protein, partial [Bacteroidales bacterium]|nr:SusC/RagA family TonB-linked outer membrane protein [Bacteroidales bacterium]
YLPGDYRLLDFDGNGFVNQDDQVPYGYPSRPQNTYGLSFGVDFKGFSIMAQLYGHYNITRTTSLNAFAFYSPTVYQEHLDNAWWPELEQTADATLGSPSLDNVHSGSSNGHYWESDATLLRLKNAEIAYTFKSEFLKRYGLSSLRIYANGNNLYLWSSMLEDRETGDLESINYPLSKRINFGLDITF